MLDITCPNCSKNYRVAPENAGKQVRCQQCNTLFAANSTNINPPPVLNAVASDVSAAATDTTANTIGSHGFFDDSPPPYATTGGMSSGKRIAHEIDYQIHGDDTQYVEIILDPGETVIAEAGAMMFMSSGIEMQTVFGDPSKSGGGFWDKVVTAGKRVLTGESLFMTTFTNSRSSGREVVAFGAPYPGHILPMHLDTMGGEIICQKDAFLCGAKGLEIGIAFQKKIAAALFGGEGFIMQRIRGDGIALVHAGGAMMYRMLAPGEQIRLDTGCLMALGPTVSYDIQWVGGFKNTFFGGEGLFMATVTGPGPVWLQSLPFSRLAGRIVRSAGAGRGGKEEGSLLGNFGGMFLGDRE